MSDDNESLYLVRVYCSNPSDASQIWHQDFEDLYQAQMYADAMKRHFEYVHTQIIIFKEVDRIDT